MAADKPAGKHPGGRPEFVPTDEQRRLVEAMASVGIPQPQIGSVIGICHVTLRKHFRDELDNAEIKANAKVAGNLFRQATKDDPRSTTAAIFWTKTRMGWKEPVYNVHSGSVGVDFIDNMSPDELDRYIEERTRAAGLRSDAEGEVSGERKPN
jgi:hypothetical protein